MVLWAGWPFFVRGWSSLLNRSLNMFTLVAMGTGVAYLYSVVATLAPQLFPPAFRDMHGMVAVYFEAAAVITVLVLLGQVLELRARESTSGAIKALLDLAPKTARRIAADGSEHDVQLDEVRLGDRLRVRPGDKVPVDGVVIEGRSAVDESMVTGESMPVTKEAGANVIGGTINQSGALVIEAKKIGRDTMLAQIVQLVADAQRSRAPIQRLADQVSAWFVPAVILVAVAAFAAWATFGPEPRFTYGLVAAVAVLIIACPCALGLATPMSIMVGVGRGAQSGVLIKNAEALERMEKVDTLVVDKTGTLTLGKPSVTKIIAAGGFDEADVLRLAASVERASEHPIATAIVRAAAERAFALSAVTDFDSPTGKGALGTVDGKKVVLGNASFLAERGIDVKGLATPADQLRQDGATAIFAGIDGRVAGVLAIADPVKPTTSEALAGLKAAGVHVVMLTGDNATTARAIARQLQIDDVEAEVLPEQKSEVVNRYRARGSRGRDGRRRRQRCAGAGGRGRRHCDGNRNRRRHGKRRRHAAQGRPHGDPARAKTVASRDAQHPAESVFRLYLQRARRAGRSRRALSKLRHPAVADHRRGGDVVVIGQRDRQRAAAARRAALVLLLTAPSGTTCRSAVL